MSKEREALKLALAWVRGAAEHDQHCDLLDLDEDGKHKPCSCGLDSCLTAIREALAEQPTVKQSLTVEQPAQQQEPVVWMYVNRSTHETVFQKHMRSFIDHSQWKEVPLYGKPLANHELQCVCGAVWCGDEMVHLPDKRPPASKPLPFNKDDMEGLDINQRLAFKLGWRSAEQAHGIKENT